MHNKFLTIKKLFNQEIAKIKNAQELDALRIKYLGRKGLIQGLMKDLRQALPDEKPEMGKWINVLKREIEREVEICFQKIKEEEFALLLKQEWEDISLPGRPSFIGRQHPISKMIDEVTEILIGMGFSIQSSPEIESDYCNYEALNYSSDHPARDMQDTFYITSNTLLRSHTTSIQPRIMSQTSPPFRIFSFGKCYRNETVSSRSHVLFYQVDVFYVDKGVTFSNLLATQEEFYTKIFKQEIDMRVRPSYFPFVEPGMEVDIRCTKCKGNGCFLCKHTGWIEVCGAGMVHPEVLKAGGIDPQVYSGYAWGAGIERPIMLRHGINDIRFFTENDIRFLSQFF